MTTLALRRWTGYLFIVGAILVNIPYTLLIMNFEYPQILRQSTDQILTKFQAGGIGLIFQWFAFAWIGFPLLLAVIMLRKAMVAEKSVLMQIATVLGVGALIVQIIGLLRWTFVVPVLSSLYTAPNATPASKEAITVVFQVVNQFGGVLLGEHLGQLLIIIWMFVVSLLMFKSNVFAAWLGWFGIVTSVVYLLAQGELFATVIPNFPILSLASLVGSILWLVWMIIMGVFLVRAKALPQP